MNINAGDFWVADIKFTDSSTSKKRPVLILWIDKEDVIVAAVTSSLPRTDTDIALKDWKNSGLKVPSTVRLSRLDCLEKSLLVHRLGNIIEIDSSIILNTWKAKIYPQF